MIVKIRSLSARPGDLNGRCDATDHRTEANFDSEIQARSGTARSVDQDSRGPYPFTEGLDRRCKDVDAIMSPVGSPQGSTGDLDVSVG